MIYSSAGSSDLCFDLRLRSHYLHVPELFQLNTFQFLWREYTIIKKPISNILEINKPLSCPLQSTFGVRPYALEVIIINFIILNYNHTFRSSYSDHNKPRIWVGWGSHFNPL